MRRWFLSYNSQDVALVQALETALRRTDVDAHIFFAPRSLRAGGYWLPELAREIAEATAFVLLVGEKGLGSWQVAEYYEAIDRRVKEHNFPVVLVLLEGQAAPGLPFLRQLHWIVTPDPATEQFLGKLLDAVTEGGTRPNELWRYTAPYRGLPAMTAADSDFFFGRASETVEVIRTFEATPNKLPILVGNSGVGKSSLAQAGVMAALSRQGWPERTMDAGPWPQVFCNTRQWCFLTVRPGVQPITALVESFLETWQFKPGDPARIKYRNEWVELLLDEKKKTSLLDLINETERRYEELNRPKPPAFFLYVDQGEELYVRAEPRQRKRFSEILAHGLSDRRLQALMSLRADFSGALQNDQPLFEAYQRIEVPPLREAQLREIVNRPAALLSARFETDHLAFDIARQAAEDSIEDVGALPLLSYLLDDMWDGMIRRGDGILRMPSAAIELGGVLANRVNSFLSDRPQAEHALQRLLTLKLATVRDDGEPTRRRAARSEFTEEEWRLASELADHPYRVLVTATPASGETYAEVAHEAVFRRWQKLRDWIAAEREFLAWKTGLEAARRAWQAMPDGSTDEALLMGVALMQAQSWFGKRADDIPTVDRGFIELSRKTAQRRRLRIKTLIAMLAFFIFAGVIGWLNEPYLRERWRRIAVTEPYLRTQVRPYVLTATAEQALNPKDSFRECAKDCPEMVVVPAGDFMMGSLRDEVGHEDHEDDGNGRLHSVAFAKAFAASKFEVTFDEWNACVDYGNCDRVGDGGREDGRLPVVDVTWHHAMQYAAWLRYMTGKPYRLLSEAEWEYAARAKTSTAYSWGDKIGKNNASCNGCDSQWDRQLAPAGSFTPNAFGLHDMHGNVWEWVVDCYHGNYSGAPTDGSVWENGDCKNHVARGGSFANIPQFLRAAQRGVYATIDRNRYIGFRIARTLTQ
jgi:formylglycine-generating enzyme required for sulfatase activity